MPITTKEKQLLTAFAIGLIGFIILISLRPSLPPNYKAILQLPQTYQLTIHFPPTAHQLYLLSRLIPLYSDHNFAYCTFAFFYLYILLQTFAIPGPAFLCILSPSLFGSIPAFVISLSVLLPTQCSCLGASCCFFLSQALAHDFLQHKFPTLFGKFSTMVNQNRHHLFWYMLFLRLTPLVPNWFVNAASPLVDMPYHYFLIASIFGLMPNNFILINTGLTLKDINDVGVSLTNVLVLLCLAFLSLIPTLITKPPPKQIAQTKHK